MGDTERMVAEVLSDEGPATFVALRRRLCVPVEELSAALARLDGIGAVFRTRHNGATWVLCPRNGAALVSEAACS
jgi:hypothetical protein